MKFSALNSVGYGTLESMCFSLPPEARDVKATCVVDYHALPAFVKTHFYEGYMLSLLGLVGCYECTNSHQVTDLKAV